MFFFYFTCSMSHFFFQIEGSCSRVIHFHEFAPPPIVPKGPHFLDFNASEIARQLCIIEFEIYAKIRPTECVNQAWTKKDKEILAPNITQMVQQSNKLPMTIASIILSEQLPTARAKMISTFLKIASVRSYQIYEFFKKYAFFN